MNSPVTSLKKILTKRLVERNEGEHATLDNINIRDVDFGSFLGTEVLSNVSMKNMVLTNCAFSGLTLENVDFEGTKFINCKMAATYEKGCNFYFTKVIKSDFHHAAFIDASLEEMYISETNFTGATFHNCIMLGLHASHSNFSDTSFESCSMEDSIFYGVNFADASFKDSDLYRALRIANAFVNGVGKRSDFDIVSMSDFGFERQYAVYFPSHDMLFLTGDKGPLLELHSRIAKDFPDRFEGVETRDEYLSTLYREEKRLTKQVKYLDFLRTESLT